MMQYWMKYPYKLSFVCIALWILTFVQSVSFAAGGQILNSTYFPNPAELSSINQFELCGGNIFFNPQLTFKGSAYGQTARAHSDVNDYIPYLYLSSRLNEQWVIGLNFIPSVYGALNWGLNPALENSSIQTSLLYYRMGVQMGYQITPRLSLGAGGNLERNALDIDFFVPNFGVEKNKNANYHYNFDLGLYYKLNYHAFLKLAAYSPIYYLGRGTSQLADVINYNYQALNVDAAVVYFGLEEHATDRWKLDGKIFFSKWSKLKELYFLNRVTGSAIFPTDWKDVWSFDLINDYFISENVLLTGEILYETNPVSPKTNYVGFPLSSGIAVTAGFEYYPSKSYSIRLTYSYGTFLPNARIESGATNGYTSANIHSVILQGRYKV